LLSRFDGSGYADEGEGWDEQRKKERPKLFSSHGINPLYFPQSGKRIARIFGGRLPPAVSGRLAHATSGGMAEFRKGDSIQAMSRPERQGGRRGFIHSQQVREEGLPSSAGIELQ
jgi:hypothetical protein